MTIARPTFFLLILTSALILPLWVFSVLAFLYAFRFRGLELLTVAVIVDATFGDPSFGHWYLYTMAITVILVLVAFSEPHLNIRS